MKIAAVISNLILFGFLCLVLVEDGFPKDAAYIAFTIWALLTLLLNSAIICQISKGRCLWDSDIKRKVFDENLKKIGLHSGNRVIKITAIIFNIVFLGFTLWAIIDQYPHQKESGFLVFTVLMFLNPVLSLAELFRIRTESSTGG